MDRVTLVGIKRRGLMAWKGRERWLGRRVLIWSKEHATWWRPESAGYTQDADEAGVYDFADAWDRTKHCGPEKGIVFYYMPSLLRHIE